MGKVNEALDDFYRAYAITDKLEALPDKSYDEIAGMPPSLHALFHIGYALFLLGSNEESVSIFEKLLARRNTLTRDALAHTLLNYGKALKQQRRIDEAINSFKELIVLSQSHNTAIEIVKQAALDLSELQTTIAVELKKEKETLIADQAKLLQGITQLQNTADEEKKLLVAKFRVEKDSLMADQARLLQDIWRLQNTADEEKKILTANLQAENAQLQLLNQTVHALNQDKETLTTTLNHIYDSHGWKALLAYYKFRNAVFPPGSKRQDFAKRLFHLR
jgi:tetratricopeptide (TPR) repeat protein